MMRGIVLPGFFGLAAALILAGLCFASPLEQILTIVPLKLTETMIQFSNWSKIKSQLGLEFITSASALEFRFELARRISQDQAAASAYGLSHIRSHAEEWGWDTADLDWEANIVSRELPPTYILKLRNGFDFSPVATHFEARGFVQTESYGAIIYTHELDVRADWTRTTELSILTTAYIAEENVMILSSYQSGVEILLAARAGEITSLSEDLYARSAVQHLGDPFAAILLIGIGECFRFTPNPILDLIEEVPMENVIAEHKAALEERELLVPYQALGVGYRYEEKRPVGTIVFEYNTPELAAIDLPARRALAEEGMSSHYDAPITESYFVVLDASVKDSAAVFAVAPSNDQPSRLFRMVLYLDALFAGCS